MNTKYNILKLLKSSGRTLYINEEIAKAAPVNGGKLEFFRLNKWVSNDKLEKEYQSRGLEPASLLALYLYDSKHRDKMDKMQYVGTHWKDKDGKWCYATFNRWDNERLVDVDRDDGVWVNFWWLSGVRKPSAPKTPSTLEPLDTLACPSCGHKLKLTKA